MNNSIGLEDDRWYKVVNVGDKTVVQLEGSKFICGPEDETKKELQRFQAIAQDDEGFRLASKSKSSTTTAVVQVWDYLPHRQLLIQKKKSAAEISTQVWRTEKVPGLDCVFFIVSVPDPTRCLKNMNSESEGVGQQIKIVDKSDAAMIGDSYAHWKLVPEPLA